MGAFLYGYDGTYFTGILEMPRFLSDFGDLQPDGSYQLSSKYTSVFASIVQAGEFVGSLGASFLGDYLGRKGALRAAVIIVTIGCILQLVVVGSVSLLIVGRLILGIGVGVISNCVPMYLSEIPPAAIRGSVVSTWQLTLAIGQVSWVYLVSRTRADVCCRSSAPLSPRAPRTTKTPFRGDSLSLSTLSSPSPSLPARSSLWNRPDGSLPRAKTKRPLRLCKRFTRTTRMSMPRRNCRSWLRRERPRTTMKEASLDGWILSRSRPTDDDSFALSVSSVVSRSRVSSSSFRTPLDSSSISGRRMPSYTLLSST